jgi:hypothetical protein
MFGRYAVCSRLGLTIYRRISFACSLIFCLVLLLFPCLNYGQSFGPLKEKITLHRKLPAVVHLSETTFTVKATSSASQQDVAQLLPVMLETELLKNEKSLRVDNTSPAITISCAITNFQTPPPQTITRNQTVFEKKKPVQKPTNYYEVTGQLDAVYTVSDKAGKTIDSNTPSAKYSREFEQGTNQATDQKKCILGKCFPSDLPNPFGHSDQTEKPAVPPTADQLRQELLHQIVSQIAPRLVTTNETVVVLLAEGKQLKEANQIAEKGLWGRYLEALETMTPFPNPQEDSYRLYNIGVANEALGYETEDRAAAKKFFEEAAINYGKAVEAKPDERYFLDPQTRIETAVAYYKALDQPAVVNAGQIERIDKPPAPGHTDSPGLLTNAKIIEMFKSGVDEDSIVAEIQRAPAVDFKLDADGLIELAQSGIKGKIPAAMRERVRSSKAPSAHK